MLPNTVLLAAALALGMFGEWSLGQNGESGLIAGTVTYLQRSALQPDASFNVQLLDVSLQDVPAKVFAEAKVPTQGKQVPIAFPIPYSTTVINPGSIYALRASILSR
jgi:uncharacterized lipoprotein YbaY